MAERTFVQIRADFDANITEAADLRTPDQHAPPAEWASLNRQQEAVFLRRAQLLDEMTHRRGQEFMESYAFQLARDHCREMAESAAQRAEHYEAQVGGAE